MRFALTALVAGTLLAPTVPVQAHHSFAAVYDANKPVTLRGTVSKLGWTNPHVRIYIDVKDQKGQAVTWEIESAGASNLQRAGLRRDDFVGTEVIVKGYLAKDGTPSVNALSFTVVGTNKEFTDADPAASTP
jgi:hypothetical protein